MHSSPLLTPSKSPVKFDGRVIALVLCALPAFAAQRPAPTTDDIALAGLEDTASQGILAAKDPSGGTLSFSIKGRARHGEAAIDSATGAFTYTPAKDFSGEDAFSVEVSNGKRKAVAAVKVDVAAVNDAPVTKGLSLTTLEDTAARGKVIGSDADGDALAYVLTASAQHGEATVDSRTGAVRYQPAADYTGADAFTVEVTDGRETVTSGVSVVVTAVNDAPRVTASTFPLDEDSRFEGKAIASDVDADALVYRVVRKPAHGAFELNAQTGAFTFQPARDYYGPDAFTLEVSDGKLKAESAISLDVRAVNDAPVAKPLVLSTKEDTAAKGGIVANDVDNAALTYSVREPPAHGEAVVDARTGAVSYLPAADYNGVDAFSVEVKDGAASVTTQVSVAIAAVPDVPRVQAAVLPTPEDAIAEGMLPGSDADGDRLTFRLLSQPRLGSAVLVDAATGAWRFTPGADLNGDDEIAFEVSDGTTTVKGMVKIAVAPVNDAPTLAGLELATIEDQGVEGVLVGNDIDGDPLTYSVSAAPKRGQAAIVGTGVRFEPARDQNGPAAFTVTVSDGKATSAPAQISVRIDPQNDAPVALESRLTTEEDTQLVGAMKATDVDGERVVFAVVRPPIHGTVTVTDFASGLFVYTPAPNFFGEDDFAFSATDPSRTASVANIRLTVTPVDDVPIADASGISAPFRGTVTGRLHGFDRESKSVTYRIVDQPANGRVKLLNARTGDFEFSTDGTTSSATGFSFEVSDGALTSAPAELVVQIRSL